MIYRDWWIEPENGGFSFVSQEYPNMDPLFEEDMDSVFKRIDEIEADSCLYLEVECHD